VHHVLLVGPDDDARRALHVMIDRLGVHVSAVVGLDGARSYLGNGHVCDAVFAPGDLATQLVLTGGTPPVIAVVRPRDVTLSRSLLAGGVDDVVTDPLDELALALALHHVATLPRRPAPVPAPALVAAPALIGGGEVMRRLREMIDRVAGTRSTVLILGESGTGKELVARAIHDASPRRARRFVAINCAAIPAALLESELFGHCRGAFTDAVRDKPGLFEDADGGTLLLDEIGELPLALQAKLLRALQEGEIRRVGDTASIQVDVRLIAATLRDLADDVRDGRFREDLYYRLNVLPVSIPPLRERTEDIPQLSRFFAQRHAARHQLDEIELSDAAVEVLVRQPWPGNVRELENVIERAVVLADRPGPGAPVIDVGYLGTVMTVRAPASATVAPEGLSIKKATRDIEQDLIKRALGVTQGNRTNAAKLLEISHRALLYKMKEYGIS
jgi:two-component system response regulator AtoC